MTAESKYCDTCQVQVIDKDGTTITSCMHLVKGYLYCYICVDCCIAGRHGFYENEGYKQAGYKIVADENKLFDNLK